MNQMNELNNQEEEEGSSLVLFFFGRNPAAKRTPVSAT